MSTVRIQLRRGLASEWTSVNPTLAAGEVGVESDTNTLKFGDGTTAWNSLSYALSNTVDDYQPISEKGNAGGYASLDGSGFVPVAQLPPTVKITVNAVANQAARLALSVQAGDIAIQSDTGTTYVLSVTPATTDANWKEISATAAISAATTAAASDATSKVAAEAALRISGDSASVSTAASDASSKANAAKTDAEATAAADATTKANAAKSAAEATAASALAAHSSDTTDVHGIANTALLATTANVATAKGEAIADASADATSKANAAQAAAEATAASALAAHSSDTTDVHGIANTGLLATTANVASAKSETLSEAATAAGTALSTHEADTTSVHGIADTSVLVTLNGNQTLTAKTLTSPTMTGTPVAPTASAGTDTTQIATTAFVQDAIEIVVGAAPDALNTLAEIATSLNNNADLSGSLTTSISNKVAKAGDTMTGVLNMGTNKITSLGTATTDFEATNKFYVDARVIDAVSVHQGSTTNIHGITDTSALAYTSDVNTLLAAKAPLASPTFTGTVSGITKTMVGLGSADNTADTAKPVSTATQTELDLKLASATAASTYAPLASPVLTGTPAAPTAAADTNSTQIATTAFAKAEADAAEAAAASDATTKANAAKTDAEATAAADATAKVAAEAALRVSGDSASVSTAATSAAAIYAPLASPTFTGTVTLPAGTITAGMILDGTVSSSDIASDAVTTAKILDANVTTAKINDSSITSGKIAASAVTEGKIADGAVTSGKIADGTIVDTDVSSIAEIAQSKISGLSASFALKADLASPTFTGTVSGITKTMVGLGSADNTADTAKPVSTATQTALDLKLTSATAASTYAPLASPALTGVPTAPTAAVATNTTQVATTAYVRGEVAALVNSASGTLDTLGEIATALGNDANLSTTLTNAIALKAPLASPTFTGTNTVANITVSGTSNMSANGVQFSDGTQTKIAVPSLTTTTTTVSAAYNLSTVGLTLRDQLINIAGAYAITIPTNATTAFPVGTSISFWQSSGAGGASFVAADGAVSVYATPGATLRALYSSATITKVGTNAWIVAGDLKA